MTALTRTERLILFAAVAKTLLDAVRFAARWSLVDWPETAVTEETAVISTERRAVVCAVAATALCPVRLAALARRTVGEADIEDDAAMLELCWFAKDPVPDKEDAADTLAARLSVRLTVAARVATETMEAARRRVRAAVAVTPDAALILAVREIKRVASADTVEL